MVTGQPYGQAERSSCQLKPRPSDPTGLAVNMEVDAPCSEISALDMAAGAPRNMVHGWTMGWSIGEPHVTSYIYLFVLILVLYRYFLWITSRFCPGNTKP